MYLYVMKSICAEMHVDLVYVLRKQNTFDTVFYTGVAVFGGGQYFYEVFVYSF